MKVQYIGLEFLSNILYFYIMKEDIFALFEKQQAAEPKAPEPERVPGEEPAKEEPAAEEVPQQEPAQEETQNPPEEPAEKKEGE